MSVGLSWFMIEQYILIFRDIGNRVILKITLKRLATESSLRLHNVPKLTACLNSPTGPFLILSLRKGSVICEFPDTHIWSFRIRRTTFLKYIKLAILLIVRLENCAKVGRVTEYLYCGQGLSPGIETMPDMAILCSSEAQMLGFWGPRIVECSVGWLSSFRPDEQFPNFRASRSGDQRILWRSGASHDGF